MPTWNQLKLMKFEEASRIIRKAVREAEEDEDDDTCEFCGCSPCDCEDDDGED